MGSSKINKIAVAMSGGVDSSVAAALLADKYGKENVIGITMKIFCYGDKSATEKSCCSLESIDDARNVANTLGIAHYVVNLEEEFEREVISDFVSEYEQGLTPNPCIRCNDLIKFKYLMQRIREYGCDALATGHYARVLEKGTKYRLYKGRDESKDQSYFLAGLAQETLAHVLLPLGDLTKKEVRELARKYGLKTAEKQESQDICFIPTTTEEFLAGKIKPKKGLIVDSDGKEEGTHEGIAFYTVGQRKGLGGGFKEKMYVVEVKAKANQVVIGSEAELYGQELLAENINWLGEKDLPFEASAKIRYQAKEASCRVEKTANGLKIYFEKPQKAITPGQTIVFYDKDEVLGAAKIKAKTA